MMINLITIVILVTLLKWVSSDIIIEKRKNAIPVIIKIAIGLVTIPPK